MAAAVRHTPRARARTPASRAPGLGSQWCPRSEPPKMTFGRRRQRPIYYHRRREPRRLAERARRLVPACRQPHGDQCQVPQPPHLTICTCSQSGAATATVLIHSAVRVLCVSEIKELHCLHHRSLGRSYATQVHSTRCLRRLGSKWSLGVAHGSRLQSCIHCYADGRIPVSRRRQPDRFTEADRCCTIAACIASVLAATMDTRSLTNRVAMACEHWFGVVLLARPLVT